MSATVIVQHQSSSELERQGTIEQFASVDRRRSRIAELVILLFNVFEVRNYYYYMCKSHLRFKRFRWDGSL